jgi:prepilin-type processing-associated H-X9-DG protein
MAIAALVMGIVGLALCPIFSIVALILGIVATVRASSEPTVYGGKGMAIAGICLGGVALLWFPMMVSILLPSLSRARELAKRAVDASNLRGVGQACMIYANDNSGRFPPDFQALLDAGLITPGQLQNPSDPDVADAWDHYFVRYDAETDWDAEFSSDWVIAYSDPAYHNDEGANILFVDGHVEFIKEPRFTETIDDFKREFEARFGTPPTIIEPQ